VFWTIQQHGVRAWHEIEARYDLAIDQGHEGLIVRSSEGGYKHGRATINQAIIFKMKPEETVDAQIIEVVPRKERIDTAHGADNSRFSLFHAERRTHRASAFKAVEAAGSFKVRTADGLEFFTSLGKIDKTERARLWEDRDNLLGRWVEIECMGYGAVTAPRHPRVKRFRPDKDK
jgi:ATP-dependent DNA ligase